MVTQFIHEFVQTCGGGGRIYLYKVSIYSKDSDGSLCGKSVNAALTELTKTELITSHSNQLCLDRLPLRFGGKAKCIYSRFVPKLFLTRENLVLEEC